MADLFEEVIERVRQHPKLIIVDDFEISVYAKHSRRKRFADGETSEDMSEDQILVGLRLVHRKQPGSATVSETDKASLSHLVESAFSSSRLSSPNPWFRFPLWRSSTANPTPIPVPHPTEWLYDSLEPHVTGRTGSLEEVYSIDEKRFELFRKSERSRPQYRQTIHRFGFRIAFESGGTRGFIQEERARSKSMREDRTKPILRAVKLGGALTHAQPVDMKGRHCVLLSPPAASEIVKGILPWFFFDQIQFGKSPLAFPESQPEFSKLLSLVDDGLLPGAAHSVPFDCEGVPGQRTELVRDGKIVGALFDSQMASRENRLSTGNFVGQGVSTGIGVTNSYFEPRAGAFAEFLREMTSGIAIESVQSLTWRSGRCVLTGCGWWVEQGQPVCPVSGVEVTLDINQALRSVSHVGKDLMIFDHFGSPSLLLQEIPLGE